jgi:hypothetical protein
MASGGARARSGPAPDPNALRRDRPSDKGWTVLPAEGRVGPAPVFPLNQVSADESDLWSLLWLKPQAVMWDRLGMSFQIAAYVRAFLESVEPSSSAGIKTAVLRMEGELGLSIPGMASLRWKFAEDEITAKRSAAQKRPATSARARLAAVDAV